MTDQKRGAMDDRSDQGGDRDPPKVRMSGYERRQNGDADDGDGHAVEELRGCPLAISVISHFDLLLSTPA